MPSNVERRNRLFVLFCWPVAAVALLSSCGPGNVATPRKVVAKTHEVQRVPVTSTNLQSVGYDEDSRTLTIEFRNGSIYEYENVPPEVHAELMNADSHGKYFHRHIRNTGFAAQRVQ